MNGNLRHVNSDTNGNLGRSVCEKAVYKYRRTGIPPKGFTDTDHFRHRPSHSGETARRKRLSVRHLHRCDCRFGWGLSWQEIQTRIHKHIEVDMTPMMTNRSIP